MLFAEVARVAVDALNLDTPVVVDVEGVYAEEALRVYTMLTECNKVMAQQRIVERGDGAAYTVQVSVDLIPSRRDGMIAVVVTSDENVARRALFLDNVVAILVAKEHRVDYPAIVEERLVERLLRRVLGEARPQRLRFIGRVPYTTLLADSDEKVEYVAARWRPPPPARSSPLAKDVGGLGDLVLAPDARRLVEGLVEAIRVYGSATILAAGLPGSGRKTLAYAIARELGRPAYYTSIASFLDWKLGETEKNFAAFFATLRGKRAVAVLEGLETLFRRGGGGNEGVASNLRSILLTQLGRHDNDFVLVLSAGPDMPPDMLATPLLGDVKLVLAPPTREERRALAERFLRRLVRDAGAEHLVEEYGWETLASYLAHPVADTLAGATPGQLYRVMRVLVHPVVKRAASGGRLEIPEVTPPPLGSTAAKLRDLENLARELGLRETVEKIERVLEELSEVSG
jgi:hypothetical protein